MDMYFKLPTTEYQNLTRDKLLDKLTLELEDFAKTEEFKNSFFTNSCKIVFETNGQIIWAKQ